jgi:DNA-binding NarL/FixJ family response regulator
VQVPGKVVLVEDHTLLAESVGLALAAEGWYVVIADLQSEDALLSAVSGPEPALVLLDLELGEPIRDSTCVIPALVDAGATVLVVTGVHDRVRLAATIEAGAVGFVAKTAPFDVLLATARRAAAGEPVLEKNEFLQLLADLRRHRAQLREACAPFDALTPRERAVLAQLSDGKSVDTIADEWFVSPATVRTQVRGVLTKLDVSSQLAAVAKARAAGWTA